MTRLLLLMALLNPCVADAHELSMGRVEIRQGTAVWLGPGASPTLDLAGTELRIEGVGPGFTTAVSQVGRPLRVLKGPGVLSLERAEPAGLLWMGAEHVLGGPDHLLFVLGLFLIVMGGRALLLASLGFTVGHSLAMISAVLAGWQAPSAPVELLIALSVVLLARDAVVGAPDSWLRRRPWLVAGGFGLIHGLGFAGAIFGLGLSGPDALWPLLTFNVGVEVGQLAFLAACLLARRAVNALPWRPGWIRLAPAYMMGALAMFWTLQRLPALWGGS